MRRGLGKYKRERMINEHLHPVSGKIQNFTVVLKEPIIISTLWRTCCLLSLSACSYDDVLDITSRIANTYKVFHLCVWSTFPGSASLVILIILVVAVGSLAEMKSSGRDIIAEHPFVPSHVMVRFRVINTEVDSAVCMEWLIWRVRFYFCLGEGLRFQLRDGGRILCWWS